MSREAEAFLRTIGTLLCGACCIGPWLLSYVLLGRWAWKQQGRWNRKSEVAAREMIQRWGQKHGYAIQRCERRYWTPWLFWKSSAQRVFYVVLRDENEIERRVWLRCGGWFLGTLSEHVAEFWENPPEPPPPSPTRRPATPLRDVPLWDDWIDG